MGYSSSTEEGVEVVAVVEGCGGCVGVSVVVACWVLGLGAMAVVSVVGMA